MTSLEKELGLINTESESSYFDYVEQKTLNTGDSRTRLVDEKKKNSKRLEFTKDAKLWKEFTGF